MKTFFHIPVLFALMTPISLTATGQQSAQAQAFSCRVLETRHFTNVELIPLEVRLRSKDLDVDRAALNPSQSPKPQSGDPYLEIYAEQVIGKARKRVQLKLTKTGDGRDLDESYVHYMVEIPIDESEKKEKISKHLDDLVREAKVKKNADPKTIRMYEEKNSRQALTNTFDRMYMQNRDGTFEINCRYTANSTQHPETLESRPAQIIVDFKSNFLDQPNFH
jgi:hypothetical protein